MANTIRDYSATPANNTVVDGADISEGCSPAGINDAIRGVMADLKDVSTGAVALESPAFDSASLTGDLTLGDNDKAIFGAGNDLQIYHDGSNSYVQDTGTGDIIIKGDNVRLQDSAGGNLLVADSNDAVQLYYGYNQKLATTATGVDITGGLTTTGNVGIGTASPTSGRILDANGQVRFQASSSGRYFDFVNDSAASYLDVSHALNIRTGGASSLTTALTINSSGHQTQTGYTAYGTSAIGYVGDAANLFSGSANDFAIRGTSNVTFGIGASEKMRIDSSGRVTMPYQPAFVAVDGRGQGQQAIANANISQYFTTAQTNIGNGFSTSTGRFTAPVAGYYVFGWNLFTTGISADTVSRIGIIKNGSSSAGEWSGGDRVGHANQGSIGIYLNANDYITLGTQGGSYTAYWYSDTQHSRFWGYLVA